MQHLDFSWDVRAFHIKSSTRRPTYQDCICCSNVIISQYERARNQRIWEKKKNHIKYLIRFSFVQRSRDSHLFYSTLLKFGWCEGLTLAQPLLPACKHFHRHIALAWHTSEIIICPELSTEKLFLLCLKWNLLEALILLVHSEFIRWPDLWSPHLLFSYNH